jgi:maltose alpha-D-glucosyltransferase/alpha-amylase
LIRTTELLESFRAISGAALLQGYDEGCDGALPPVDHGLLALFTLEKAAYEVRYEAANRPDWLTVPLNGLAQLAGRVLGGVQ